MLAQLLLQSCHISEQGACELAAALCKNSTPNILELDNNPIGVEGASSMSDMLKHITEVAPPVSRVSWKRGGSPA